MDITQAKVDKGRAHLQEAEEALRKAKTELREAKIYLMNALADEAGLKVGDKIMLRGGRKAFVDSFTVHRGWRDEPETLAVYYRKVKKNGEPFAAPGSYSTTQFTKGWEPSSEPESAPERP